MIADPYAEGNLAKFILTQTGNALLFDRAGGYAYKNNSRNGSKIYWVCRSKKDRIDGKCMARAITHGNYVTYWKGGHNHPSNILESDVIMENYDYFSK